MIFLLFPMIVFASFWDRFLEIVWIVFGLTFGAFRGQKGAKILTKIDAEIGIGKVGSEEARQL